MSKQTINVGTVANDGTGDTIRAAMGKVNANFDELYETVSEGVTDTLAYYNSQSTIDSCPNLYYKDGKLCVGGEYASRPITINGTSNETAIAINQTGDITSGPYIVLIKSRGTQLVPTATETNDSLGTILTSTYDQSSSGYVTNGRLIWRSTDSSTNSIFTIQTRVSGITTDRISVDASGRVVLGGDLVFSNGSIQTGAAIDITALKTLVAASTDFADFQSRVAAL